MKILVTGATGFVGSRLTRQLVEAGHRVRILRRPTSTADLLGAVARQVEHCTGDIMDPDSLRAAMEDVEVVFHAAAAVHMGAKTFVQHNAQGTACVVDAALDQGVGRLVHTSSIAALTPRYDGALTDESAPWEPDRCVLPYAHSKYASELEVYRGVAEGLDVVMVNPSVVYGPGRKHEGSMQVVELVRRRRAWVYPSGSINAVDVEDVAAGHIRAMEAGKTGERYILAGENLSWKSLLSTLADALGVPAPRVRMPFAPVYGLCAIAELAGWISNRPVETTRAVIRYAVRQTAYSNAKAVAELGCTFRPFRVTAERLAQWYRAQEAEA